MNSQAMATAARAVSGDHGEQHGTEGDGPIDFHHPFTPYDIQETFMNTVYQIIEASKVGILESPTGTGKSLSLICGSLTWLRNHEGKAFEAELNNDQDTQGEPEWILEQHKARKRRELLRQREDIKDRLARIRLKEKAQRDKYVKESHKIKRRKPDNGAGAQLSNDDEEFVLDDYESDHENHQSGGSGKRELSAKTVEMMTRLGMISKVDQMDEELDETMKIFYCSRTHSQLTQFINELRRVDFPPSIIEEVDSHIEAITDPLKHVTLGSRKNLCIHPVVSKLDTLTAVNERCAELQQSTTPLEKKCPHLPNKENQPLVNNYRDHALASIRDIEDMGALGKEIGICPYYASRSAIKPAEIVTLPYPLLLQKSAREALGINVKGHVIIIDEAHNLMDAIAGIYGIEISLRRLKIARAQIGIYLQKFKNRLKGKNRIYVAQTIRVIDSLAGYLQEKLAGEKSDGIVNDQELLSGKGADQINLFKLIKYLQESKLARKVEGYVLHFDDKQSATKGSLLPKAEKIQKPEFATPVLHQVSSLLFALTHPSEEGRLFFTKSEDPSIPDDISLRFMLLDPSTSFQEIVSEARAVILAGGTMSPMSDYTNHLFPYLAPEKIQTLSCGHVIPKENLIAWNISKRPGSTDDFEFTFKKRDDVNMIDDLGRALLNICTIVPDGVVVFFPSYNYLDGVVKRWQVVTGAPSTKSIWERLESKKSVFREKKEASAEAVLGEYADAITVGKGGLLFSVVGGKMSEGINFSDALGRCVVIIGLPFPNMMSAEWKAKLEYIENTTMKQLAAEQEKEGANNSNSNNNHHPHSLAEMQRLAKDASRDFYENACMRAVNQSVGRAIRHRGDYAAILMFDRRFANPRIVAKLPGWIQSGLVPGAGEKPFGQLMGALGGFFRAKKKFE